MTFLISWIGSVVAAIAGVSLIKGSKETQQARILAAAGAILPLAIAIISGPASKAFAMLLPFSLILTAAGGLLFSNIEEPKQNTARVYAAVFSAIVGFSTVGWALVLAN